MSLSELAEQCEQATRANASVDADIERALGMTRINSLEQEVFGGGRSLRPKRYTGSIDAAMTLVGTNWYLSCLTERDEFNNAKACFTEVDEPCRDAVGTAAYLELAICAAALRARAASGMSAFGQDPKGLEAKPGSPVPRADEADAQDGAP